MRVVNHLACWHRQPVDITAPRSTSGKLATPARPPRFTATTPPVVLPTRRHRASPSCPCVRLGHRCIRCLQLPPLRLSSCRLFELLCQRWWRGSGKGQRRVRYCPRPLVQTFPRGRRGLAASCPSHAPLHLRALLFAPLLSGTVLSHHLRRTRRGRRCWSTREAPMCCDRLGQVAAQKYGTHLPRFRRGTTKGDQVKVFASRAVQHQEVPRRLLRAEVDSLTTADSRSLL